MGMNGYGNLLHTLHARHSPAIVYCPLLQGAALGAALGREVGAWDGRGVGNVVVAAVVVTAVGSPVGSPATVQLIPFEV